jgi:tripartite-type tricarboxylate transporter receptor subunit TctC
MKTLRHTLSILLLACACAPAVQAQEYPSQAIRMVVPLSPGGSADLLARLVSRDLADRLGKPVLVENRVGGGGHIGSGYVAKAAPDGSRC